MTDPFTGLIADGVIDQVLHRLKSGKEADIFAVQQGEKVFAAKLYKERHARNFQNNAAYKEGRSVRNSRTQRAMAKGSRFGREAEEDAWKTKESEVLQRLFDAGVRVPVPQLFYEGVLLMELVTDAEGHPAPRLIDAPIPRESAAALYADLRQQVVRILRCDLIHGDLSPYNVLLGSNGPTIIDFPQAVGAAHNQQAEFFFRRDLEGIRRFFAAIDPALEASSGGDAHEIWRAYVRRELNADFVPTGRSELASREPRRAHPPRPQQQRPAAPGQGRPPRRGGQRQEVAPANHPNESARPRPGPPRSNPPRSGPPRPAPIVSYVGQPQPAVPHSPQGAKRRRRRRRRKGGGPPQ